MSEPEFDPDNLDYRPDGGDIIDYQWMGTVSSNIGDAVKTAAEVQANGLRERLAVGLDREAQATVVHLITSVGHFLSGITATLSHYDPSEETMDATLLALMYLVLGDVRSGLQSTLTVEEMAVTSKDWPILLMQTEPRE